MDRTIAASEIWMQLDSGVSKGLQLHVKNWHMCVIDNVLNNTRGYEAFINIVQAGLVHSP